MSVEIRFELSRRDLEAAIAKSTTDKLKSLEYNLPLDLDDSE